MWWGFKVQLLLSQDDLYENRLQCTVVEGSKEIFKNRHINIYIFISISYIYIHFLFVGMTSLLTNTVAHSTRSSFRLKTNNQPRIKVLSLTVGWVKVVKNGKTLTFKVNFLCQKLFESFYFFCYWHFFINFWTTLFYRMTSNFWRLLLNWMQDLKNFQ